MALGPRLNPLFVPTVPVAIDRYQSLSQGLTAYWLMNTSGAPVDLTGRYGTAAPGPISAPVPVVTPAGRGQFWATQTVNRTGWTVFGGKILSGLANWSAVATISTTVPDNQQAIYCERSFSNGQDILKFGQSVSALGNGMGAVLRDDGGTLISTGDGVSIATGAANTVAITFDNSNLRQYSAGKLRLTSPWTGTQSFTSANIISTIGFDANDNSASWAGSILQVALFTTTLSPSQVAQLSTEPFIMLRPVVRRTFYGPATGGGSFTGSIAETAASSDATIGAFSPSAATSDISATSDVLTGSAAFPAAAADTSTSSDATSGISAATATISDTAVTSDATTALAALIAALNEGATSSDGRAGSFAAVGTVTDATSSADGFTVPGGLTATLSDTAVTTDALTASLTAAVTLSSAAATADVYSGLGAFAATLAASAGAGDGWSGAGTLIATLSDSGSTADTFFLPSGHYVGVWADVVATSDAFAGAAHFSLGLADAVATSDAIVVSAAPFPPFTPAPQRTGAIPGQSRFGTIPRRSRFGVIH